MPSYPRKHQLSNSLVYHIFNRSNSKVQIFKAEGDYCHFVKLLKDYTFKFNIKLYHWVIMPNHYHLLLEIAEPENISKLMAGLGRAYTHYHHKVYLTAGFLWQGRFKLQAIQKETYLIRCGRYIERNPVSANIVAESQGYTFSSARFYCLGIADGITTEDPTFVEFGTEISQRQLIYKKFLCDFDSEEERSFVNIEAPQGDEAFVKRLIKANGHYMPRRKGRPTKGFVA